MKWLYLSLLNKIILSEELREDRNWTSLKQSRTEGKWHMASRRCYSLIPSALKKVTSFPWTLDVSHRDCQQSGLDRNSPWKTLKISLIPRASICNEATVTTIRYVVRWFYHKVRTHIVCPIFCWKTPHICSEGIKNFRCLTQKSQCLVFLAYLGIYIPQCRKRSDAVCISISSASTKMGEVQRHFNGTTGINNMQNVSPFTLGETMVHRERSVCAGFQTKSTMNTFRKIKIKSSSCLMHASIQHYISLFSGAAYWESHIHFNWFSFVCSHEKSPSSAAGYQWLDKLFEQLSRFQFSLWTNKWGQLKNDKSELAFCFYLFIFHATANDTLNKGFSYNLLCLQCNVFRGKML